MPYLIRQDIVLWMAEILVSHRKETGYVCGITFSAIYMCICHILLLITLELEHFEL